MESRIRRPKRASLALSERLRQRDRFEHRFGLVEGLLVFTFRSGVIDPAAARLHVGFAVLEQSGANGDAAIEIAVEREIADATTIRSSRGLLELSNDLHGPDFRRPA